MVAEAFRGQPCRLIMVGVGPLETKLRRTMPPNVELRGWLERSELAELYARASGFVHVAEEDFGMTMVEALASGTPVIALARGGAAEIVRDGIDGILLDAARPDAIRQAVRRVSKSAWSREDLVARSREFSRDRFLHRVATVVHDLRSSRSEMHAA